MIRCGSCGEDNARSARFCSACGAPLTAEGQRDTRRVVTVLFADLVGSTTIGERLEAETFRAIQTRYFTTVRAVIERYGGTVEKYIGDAVMAVFGLPTLHEDDALRAVRAAADLVPWLGELDAEIAERHGFRLQIRVGVHTGEVVAGDAAARQAMVSGDTVNTAARLEAVAGPGEILLGPVTNGARARRGGGRGTRCPVAARPRRDPHCLPAGGDHRDGGSRPAAGHAAGRARGGAGCTPCGVRQSRGRSRLRAGHDRRSSGHREEPARPRVPGRRRAGRDHRPRSLSELRRRHHLLGVGGDPACRHRRRGDR